ncbi:MFS transporter [Nocardioides gansuensis]|uniref:MFS transporter n=1 Tax=Nocardioides gansuensis TaxID=2138300 RepID=A0A2T8FFW1_9ACTN|nr:MFS transporter [Nocardioides gansuensis]PVG84611.1 MFS transporter [Nocardioides gansuensis]
MSSPRPTLASFWHDLPREGRFLLSVVVFEFIGTGLVLPFHVVYLHEVRDFPLSSVGVLLALPPLAGFLATGPGGHAIDRFGARVNLMGCLVLLIVGDLVLVLADTLWLAGLGLVLGGVAHGLSWPAWQSLVAAVIPQRLRQRYFGLNFALLNLGIGLGGILGGLLADVDRLVTFQALYLVDALSFVPALTILLLPLRHVAGRPVHDAETAQEKVSYLAVLRRPAVAPVVALGFLVSFVGYAQLNIGMPAFARALGEVSTRGLGFAFAANTAVIVVLQLLVLQRIEGHRRTRVIVVMGLAWACSWLLLGASGLAPGTLGATLLVAACASVFAFGESLMQPTLPALVNDLAPDHLRGRYNALSSGSFQLAAIIAPVVAGWLIDHDAGYAYIALLVLGSLGVGLMAVGHVERRLPPGVNGVREDDLVSVV